MLRKFLRNNSSFLTIIILANYVYNSRTEEQEFADNKIVITPKIYSNMLIRRREEQKLFVKHLLKADYEKNYKMLDLAYGKIFEIINENNATLVQSDYNPKKGFPTDQKLQDAVTLIMENTCLVGEIILHLPEISYRILQRYKDWKKLFNWGIQFVDAFPQIINEETAKMLDLFSQEINSSARSQDFVNPYYKTRNTNSKSEKRIKARKKRLKKGPQLMGKLEL